MSKTLIIVESPAKAKTIEKFLGTKYKVVASIGHIRDLPKSKMGVDIENNFEPQYINIRGKGDLIKSLKKEAAKATKVLLAPDPDREGEAISWHLAHILGLDINEKIRVTFNEITKDAIKNAVKSPREINLNLVDAQQARRILDRLVGYSISPVLWRKLKKGLSAGRVQSVATKLVCDREALIEGFVERLYYKVEANAKGKDIFHLSAIKGKKKMLEDEKEVAQILENLKSGSFQISDVIRKNRKRPPQQPFTTSTLQMEASNKLGFGTGKTMMVAQMLYEGIKLSEGTTGLITYMRTDSTRISDEARKDAVSFITRTYGENYVGKGSQKANKSSAQDAHEAIRPTYAFKSPDEIEHYLTKDQLKLYKLIWERFISSQMADSEYSQIDIDAKNGDYSFKAKSSKLVFDGFQKVYPVYTSEVQLSEYEKGEVVEKVKYSRTDHKTSPPSRYTEASLVKELEDLGIGRPSTYAPTISTIITRGYVRREKKSLIPTELGMITNDLVSSNFSMVVDTKFTAKLESDLDRIEEKHIDWKKVVRSYYEPIKDQIDVALETIENIDLPVQTDVVCDKCGAYMVQRESKFGKFLTCPNYPECENIKPILKEIGVKCPKCETGQVIERKTKKLKIFYGCSTFPACKFTSWDKPVDKKCPKCGEILVENKSRGKNASKLKCSSKSCDYKE